MDNLLTVSKVFSDRIFRVPDYQRGYAWEERQCWDFLEDLELLAPDKEHFFGLLILHRLVGDGAKVLDQRGQAYNEFHVVDGQQRLTTIVLLLDAIRREMVRYPSLGLMAQGIEETYVQMYDLNGQPVSKLRLNRDTHDYFFGTVLERAKDIDGPTIRSQLLLAQAKKLLATYLNKTRGDLGDSYPSWLKDQYIKVAQQLTFVVYTVDSEADAGVVFETMNNRGKALTELEKAKNYLLYLSSKLDLPAQNDLSADVCDTWTHIFEHLMTAGLSTESDEDRLLRAHWLMAYDYDRRKWKGSRTIKKRFNMKRYHAKHPALLEDLKDYLSTLRNATIACCDVCNPSHPNAFAVYNPDKERRAELFQAGERLVRLDALATFLPLLMAVRIRYSHDPQPYLNALRLCERFAFRVYRWLQRPANTGQSTMFRFAFELYDGRSVESALTEIRGLALRYCPDERFNARFDEEELDWYRWRGLKFFLYEYEQHLADKARKSVLMTWETLTDTRKPDTVEHILPQTVNRQRCWTRHFHRRERELWTNDIGNLTLTFDNSALGNKCFAEKKGGPGKECCYAGSKLFVEQQIALYDEWTPAAVWDRRQQIAAWAKERWHVEPPPSEALPRTVIQRVLTRKTIPRSQMFLYKLLYEASDHSIASDELTRRLGIEPKQLSGVMGALGQRVNSTPGVEPDKPGIGLLLEWRAAEGVWTYTMRPELRAAIKALPKLHDFITKRSVEDIDRQYQEIWERDWKTQRADLDLYDRL